MNIAIDVLLFEQDLDQVLQGLVEAHVPGAELIRGIDEAAIEQIETQSEVILPGVYRAFLARCGDAAAKPRGRGHALSPLYLYLYPDVLALPSLIDEAVEAGDIQTQLPENTLIHLSPPG